LSLMIRPFDFAFLVGQVVLPGKCRIFYADGEPGPCEEPERSGFVADDNRLGAALVEGPGEQLLERDRQEHHVGGTATHQLPEAAALTPLPGGRRGSQGAPPSLWGCRRERRPSQVPHGQASGEPGGLGFRSGAADTSGRA
jgi:hypothetical protein